MIITRTWLQEFIDISKITTDDICKTLNSIGLEVDSLEKVRVPAGVVVGKVLNKEKHPDADKLSICQVDLGNNKVQIVCGAKNVAAGQFVPVATLGAVLGKDFKIKKAKLRGVESIGMICSSTELGLPKLNDGILELDDSIGKLVLGKELNEYPLINDDIIEIELTANRGDCLSIHGVARELSTYYKLPMYEEEKHLEYKNLGIGQVLEIECASNIESSMVFKAADFSEFKLPVLQKLRTAIADVYTGRAIQDTLNYVIHTLGVLLTAYGQSEIPNKKNLSVLKIKKDAKGFDSVYGNECLGTIGVNEKEFKEQDDRYIIQANYIEPDIISKKVFESKLKTGDIYYRSSRGSEPNIKAGIDYFTTLISKFGAKIYAGSEMFIDDKEKLTLDISIKKVTAIIGQKIPKAKIENILNSLGFEVRDGGNGVLSIRIPLFRHDIINIADVTEEIVRMIGIDNIQSKPLAIDEVNRINQTSENFIKKNKLRRNAIANGFFETVTYVFSSKEQLEKYGFETVTDKKDILNPITKELNTFRTTALLNLIEAASHNFKLGFKQVSLFEIGTIFNKQREELKTLSFVHCGDKALEDFSNQGKPKSLTFFEFAQKVLNVTGHFEIKPLDTPHNQFIHPYQSGNIIIEGKTVGYISKLHPSVADDFDLPDSFIAQIDFDAIKNDLTKVNSYSKFQASKRDLSVIAPKSMPYSEIKKAILSLKNKQIKQFNLVDIYSDEKLGENQSLTIRFILQNDEKTMEEEDITSIMDSLLEKFNTDLQIGLRD